MISNILPWTFSNSKTSVQSVHPLRNELKKSRCRIIENAQGGSSKRLVVGLYKMKKIPWKSITQGSGLAELNRRQQVPWSAYADPSPGAFYLQPLYFFFFGRKCWRTEMTRTGQVIAKPFDVLGRSWGQPWRKGSTRLNHDDWKRGFNRRRILPRLLFFLFFTHISSGMKGIRDKYVLFPDRSSMQITLSLINQGRIWKVNNLANLIFHRLNSWYRFEGKRNGIVVCFLTFV